MTASAPHPLPTTPMNLHNKKTRSTESSSRQSTYNDNNSSSLNTVQQETVQTTMPAHNVQGSAKKASRRELFDNMLLSQQKRNKETRDKLEKAREAQRQETERIQARCMKLQNDLERKKTEHKDIKDVFDKQMNVIRPKAKVPLRDLSQRLSSLQNKFALYPLTFEGQFLNQDKLEVAKFFEATWPELQNALGHLGIAENLEYPIVSLLVEKLILEEVVRSIYEAPICVGLSNINKSFRTISDSLLPMHSDWEGQLRLQLCKLAATEINSASQVDAVAQIVNTLSAKLSHLYTYTVPMKEKLTDLVKTAAELGVAMNANFVVPRHMAEGKDRFDDSFITPLQFASATIPMHVQIVISPPFFAKDDGNFGCLFPGRAICF